MFEMKLLARNLVIILVSFGWLVVDINYRPAITLAQQLSPLDIPQNDPLLPPEDIRRELSPFEIKRIRREIETLEEEANSQLKQGNEKQAFTLWFRQLRLYRALDLLEEITALGRVGETAWQVNRKEELKIINQRLNTINSEQTFQENFALELLDSLGTSYQEVRDLDNAIATYQTILQQNITEENLELEQKYLAILGELYLNKFNYARAATTYEKLLEISDENNINKINNAPNSEAKDYLLQLIQIYGYTQQTERSITVKKRLINYYLAQAELEPIAKLKISLGDNYQSLSKDTLALDVYQEAISFGRSLQQIALVSEAFENIANLYQKQQKYTLAIQTYRELLALQMQAYNSYGIMNSYESLGKTYLAIEDYEEALKAFNEGLKVAQFLNYRVSYFTNLIDLTMAKSQ